jgi:hypothetical protein
MRKQKAYQFYNDVYFQTFFFMPNWSREEIINTFHIDPHTDAQGMVFEHDGAVFIWLREFSLKNLGYLVHEATHATNCMFQMKGQKISTKNDEPQAYMNQWVFDNCMKQLKVKK